MGKILPNIIVIYRFDQCSEFHSCLILRNCQATPTLSNHHLGPHQGKTHHQRKIDSLKAQMMSSLFFGFNNKVFVNYGITFFKKERMVLHT